MLRSAAGVRRHATVTGRASSLTMADVLGPMLTTPQLVALGGAYAGYDAAFDAAFASRADVTSVNWQDEAYYDRALACYARWWRCKDSDPTKAAAMLAHARTAAVVYRDTYVWPNVVPTNGGIQPHQSFVLGLALHALDPGVSETDAAKSREAIGLNAWRMWRATWGSDAVAAQTLGTREPRIVGRVLQSFMYAHKMTYPNGGAAWLPGTVISILTPPPWQQLIPYYVGLICQQQQTNGSFPDAIDCGFQANFQAGILADVLIEYDRLFGPSAAVTTLLVKLADFFVTQWVSADGGFQYLSGSCPGQGSTSTAADLNGLIVNAIAWAGVRGSRSDLVTLAETVMAALVPHGSNVDGKHFNQEFSVSYRAAALLHPGGV